MNEIELIIKRALIGSDKCHRCGKEDLEDSFLCIDCGKWNCNDCEEDERIVCKTCARAEKMKRLK